MAVPKKKIIKHKPSPKPKEDVVHGEPVDDSKALVVSSPREAPAERQLKGSDVIGPVFNDAQLSILLNRTPKWAIKTRQGRGNYYKYVPHGYVTDVMNKAFGFNWDLVLDNIEDGKMFTVQFVDYDEKTGQKLTTPKRYVAVAGHTVVRIVVNGYTQEVVKYGFGSQEWLGGQEFGDALKGARSDLVKTCAYQYGIALDLYWDERAELDEYEDKIEKKKARDIMVKMQEGIPTTGITLMSMAYEKYGLDGDQLAKVIGLADPDDIVLMTPEQVEQAWEKVKSNGSKKK